MHTSPAVEICAGPCVRYNAGHNVHAIQGRLIGATAWEWRDAVVIEVDGRRAALAYLLEIGTPSIWHHRPLSGLLRVGEAVVVHERFHAIRSGSVVISVGISDGLGRVPEPEDELLRKPDGPVVVDLESGVGAAVTGSTRRWSMSRR